MTEVTQYTGFFPAEVYHQDFYYKNRGNMYCQAVIEPKLAKLRQLHVEKAEPEA